MATVPHLDCLLVVVVVVVVVVMVMVMVMKYPSGSKHLYLHRYFLYATTIKHLNECYITLD